MGVPIKVSVTLGCEPLLCRRLCLFQHTGSFGQEDHWRAAKAATPAASRPGLPGAGRCSYRDISPVCATERTRMAASLATGQ